MVGQNDEQHATGTTLHELCAEHGRAGEMLRRQISPGEQVDMYFVGKNTEILALTRRSLYIIKPGLLPMSGPSVVGFPYHEVTNVAVHASRGRFAFEVRTAATLPADPASVSDEIEYNIPNVVSLEAQGLPEFEGALTLVLERVANARR